MATVTFQGQAVEVLGNFPSLGSQAPDFKLTGADLSDISLLAYSGKKILLNIFPSIDTPVCALSVRKFNQEASQDAVVICISADLPFAAKRFCAAEGIENVTTASFFRSNNFTQDYGVNLTGALTGLAARAVLVLNEKMQVTYAELVSEITNEPDYSAALAALRQA